MCYAHPFKDWRPEGDVTMLELFETIQCRSFPTFNFLLKSEWNRWVKRPVSDLNCSSAEVMYIDDRDNITYSQNYLVATLI